MKRRQFLQSLAVATGAAMLPRFRIPGQEAEYVPDAAPNDVGLVREMGAYDALADQFIWRYDVATANRKIFVTVSCGEDPPQEWLMHEAIRTLSEQMRRHGVTVADLVVQELPIGVRARYMG